ncbi:MAG: hypothetical protein JWP01_2144 [Myxococcales bacterium]|nr:hypothetical protein [Myxococcales bacterium]
MVRNGLLRRLLLAPSLASLLLTAGCSQSAYADRIAVPVAAGSPQIAIGVAPVKVRAPYDVQVIREGGETAPTYAFRDRFYVAGNSGERYTIRITNPTANRIEAVVSVDGLDVVDGEAGDLRKRGYVVPPYGETRIEGFRTSQEDVATFRFSSVSDSYAGKKGKARNVGVIAVALFEEQEQVEQQQIIINNEPTYRAPYDYEEDLDEGYAPSSDAGGSMRDGSVASRGSGRTTTSTAPAKSAAPRGEAKRMAPSEDAAPSSTRPAAPPPVTGGSAGAPRRFDGDDRGGEVSRNYDRPAPKERPGLGTEFGESRYSAASYTKFVRAPGRPVAIAELRYNDTAGLMALGIPVTPMPDEGELMTRETADPFPGDSRFATPPR